MAVRVGIDVAAFTECQVLSPASWLDFSAHIRELLECGRRAAALQLWDSVCEIVHLGSPCSTSVLQVQGMPPLLQVPCCNENCRRCEEHRGGFQFPWLGTWSRRAVLVQSGTPLNEAWASYHLNEEKLDLSFGDSVHGQSNVAGRYPAGPCGPYAAAPGRATHRGLPFGCGLGSHAELAIGSSEVA